MALDERFGPPVDSYVNGSQTWIAGNGPGGATLEWRLHPVAGYVTPTGASHYDVWESVATALAGGADPGAVPVGDGSRAITALWDGLECFPAYDDEMEPGPLAASATEALGIPPDATGMVDHDLIGDTWERARGRTSVIDALLDQLVE